jgi:hypothetical protein
MLSDSGSDSGSGLSNGAIIGIVTASTIILMVIGYIIYKNTK